jgi:orotate phosphoribosyltransferase
LTRAADMAENHGVTGKLARLRELLAERSLLFQRVTLSNGRESDFYFDCKRVTLHPEGASLVADAILDVIDALPERPAAIGGKTLGADPILGAVMMRAYDRGQQYETFYVRKEAKKHGTKQWIENPPDPGTNVVIVDDVVTTGASALDAVERAEAIGCRVLAVIGLIDREEGGADAIRVKCPNFFAIVRFSEFPQLAGLHDRADQAHS